jgi:transposase
MEHDAGIDVSLERSSVCVVDGSGKIVREMKVASEPAALIGWLGSLGFGPARIGLEAGPLSQWLYMAMKQAGLAVEVLETRHVRDAFKAMPFQHFPRSFAAITPHPSCRHTSIRLPLPAAPRAVSI